MKPAQIAALGLLAFGAYLMLGQRSAGAQSSGGGLFSADDSTHEPGRNGAAGAPSVSTDIATATGALAMIVGNTIQRRRTAAAEEKPPGGKPGTWTKPPGGFTQK